MKTSNSIDIIAPALLEAQKQMGSAKKSSDNPYFNSKYADLSEVLEVAKVALNANGIAVLQPVSTEGDTIFVETFLLHSSGQCMSERMKLVLDKPSMQALGSAVSYARRYTLQSFVGMPAEDDDAERAEDRPKTATTQVVESAKRIVSFNRNKTPVNSTGAEKPVENW